MKSILSLQNELIKQVKSLHNSKGRQEHGLFIAEGLRNIESLIAGKSILKYLFYTENSSDLLEPAAAIISEKYPEAPLILIGPEVMHKISTAESPAGFLAVFAIPNVDQVDLTPGVVLAQIADPGNMGTLIRTAAAMGYETVVVVEGCDPWNPKVVQASAGTIGDVNIFKLTWQELETQKKALKLCALVVKEGQNPKDLDFSHSLIVVGNEAHGLPDEWIANCEQQMTIPMPGNTESLNAAMAGGIALYLSKFN